MAGGTIFSVFLKLWKNTFHILEVKAIFFSSFFENSCNIYFGRWGKSDSPAFGELKDYYLFYLARYYYILSMLCFI